MLLFVEIGYIFVLLLEKVMIKKFIAKTLLLFLLLMSGFVFAQDKASSKLANELFNDGNFSAALDQYLELLKTDPADLKFNYRAGVCYLNTNIDKSNAISIVTI